MKLNTFAAYVILLCIGLIVSQASDSTQPIESINLRSFANMSHVQLEAALTDIVEKREKLQYQCLLRLNVGGETKQTVIAAIVLSGFYQFQNCAADLASIIDFHDDSVVGHINAIPMWWEYPAAQALDRIGPVSVDYLVDNLATSDDELVRRLSAQTIRGIVGSDPGKQAVQNEINTQLAAKNAAGVARLKAALPLLDPPK